MLRPSNRASLPSRSPLEELEDFVVGGLGEGSIIAADGVKVRVDEEGVDAVGEAFEALDRVAGGDGRGDGDGSGVLFFDGQHRCLGGCAGGQAVIHEEDRLAGEGGAASGVESSAVGGQAFFFFFDDRVQLRLEAGVEEGGSLIQDYDIALGQGAEGKLAMNGMPDFPHDQHVQRELEHLRYGGGDHHPAPRQTQHEVGLDLLVLQVLPQLASRIFTRCEYHRVSPG